MMVQLRQEPPFQSKRHFEVKQQYDVNQQQHTETNPKQDDFFIIGPSDSKFAPSIAYPNRLKYRSRSTSPGPENIRRVGKRPVTTTTTTEQTLGEDKWKKTRPAPVKRSHTVHPKRNEAVQTEEPRKALEAEIQRIRADLERRKQQLRVDRVNRTTTTKPVEPKYSEKLQPRPRTQSPEKKIDFTPKAPRGERETRVVVAPPRDRRRQRSASPAGQIRQTEYQRAYRAPELPRPTTAVPAFRRPVTAQARTIAEIPTNYETEYRREYKPFKYVPMEQLKSTCVQAGDRMHIVPIPRPRSAISNRATANTTEFGYHPKGDVAIGGRVNLRSLTPPPDCSRPRKNVRKRRYLTEYAAKYKNFFCFSQPGSRTHSPNKPVCHTWQSDWDELRQQAELFRERDRSSHFTRSHLAQLDSASVNAWDPPSTTDRQRVDREKMRLQLSMPAAGKPSLPSVSLMQGHSGNSNADLRRLAMYDSHNVAEILDPDESWDCSSSESDLGEIHWAPKQPDRVSNQKRLRQPYPERLSSMFPQGQITQDTRAGATAAASEAHYPTTYMSDPESRNSSSCGDLGKFTMKNREYETQWDRAHKSPMSTNLDVSFSTPSPLSARSMESSASMASETLERARKQRDRVFRDYEKQRSRVYSPCIYSSDRVTNYYHTNKNNDPRTLY